MPQLKLTDYVTVKSGTWTNALNLPETYLPNRLSMRWQGDQVTLTGPLRIRVTFYAENMTRDAQGQPHWHPHQVYSYVWEIPPGHTWSYTLHEEQDFVGRIGTNAGYNLVIEPAGAELPTAVFKAGTEIPCGFAVADIPKVGTFFPSACEPCPAGVPIGLPPGPAPSLAVSPAPGGCVRPRFFNGMFITREDLETLGLYGRLKNQLQNRAAGQGVVWGLNVGRDGNKVAVFPGYGVDCCGHDLAVTTTYRVDIEALLRDPAAAPVLSGQGPHCLSLLLEYVECPEEPRPVHGDACSPESLRCEMSRVRETVRLRLVPPQKYTPDGPIGAFLDEVESLKQDPKIARLLELVKPLAVFQPLKAAVEVVPYKFKVGFHIAGGAIDWQELQPSTSDVAAVALPAITLASANVDFRLEAAPGWILLQGVVQDQTGTVAGRVQHPETELTWSGNLIATAPETLEVEFKVQDLLVGKQFATGAEDQLLSAPAIQVAINRPVAITHVPNISAHITSPRVELAPRKVELDPWPCFSEPCCPEREPVFPVFPPFLHGDPFLPGQPADPKVLIAAAAYIWLTSEMARHRVGTDNQVVTARLTLAMSIYQLILKAFFRGHSAELRRGISEALQRLLCAWCGGFLYPGPQCAGELHGVVIGCVEVESGNLSRIDPWGGRRYVVHYPLLAHWGEQIGIAPLDLTVSRLLNLVCCAAGLPAPDWAKAPRFEAVKEFGVLPVGNAYVVQGLVTTPEVISLESRLSVVRRETLSPMNFVTQMAASLSEMPPEAGRAFVRYELAGVPGITLVAPEPYRATPAPTAKEAVLTRIRELRPAAAPEVPALLRDFTDDLAEKILSYTPVRQPEESPLRERLATARVSSVAAVFSRPLAELHEKVLEAADPQAFNDLVNANEKVLASVSEVVREVTEKFSTEKNLVDLAGLTSEENLPQFTERLAKAMQLREDLKTPEENVRAAVVNLVSSLKGSR